ncbi:hypothetical protein RAS1_05430 [Phycisphaerae bacterium RAS1]|nr:hypothetical protein RAS1_05430 [Phycisphaerae bacterium RAS1]
MCTMTIIPRAAESTLRMRLAFNRDESRTRPLALPPVVRPFGARRAILPIDPVSDGTWIAVNDAGIAAGLLNVYGESGAGAVRGARSRGEIIPSILDCTSLEAALDRLTGRAELAAEFSAFDLVLSDGLRWAELRLDHAGVRALRPRILDEPLLFTSSGLGDDRVQTPRRRLFEEMIVSADDPLAQQAAFHRHRWPDRPELSVCMSRPEACTVNFAIIELHTREARLTYWPAPPDQAVTPMTLSLPIAALAA